MRHLSKFYLLLRILAFWAPSICRSLPLFSEADLLKAASQDEAREKLAPYFADSLASVDSGVISGCVARQWWNLAREVVDASHAQNVDFSPTVRKVVQSVKDKGDVLLQELNPEHDTVHEVSPAFQWAQNRTAVFLTIKFTVRWNAPGALEVQSPSVNFSETFFNFTGKGKHSKLQYLYTLRLPVFDLLDGKSSTWSTASAGKLSVTLKKLWPRKWPRLLADKELKFQNSQRWFDRQSELEEKDPELEHLEPPAFSPPLCALNGTVYCIPLDSCMKPKQCKKKCPGKEKVDRNKCLGPPLAPKLNFTDKDAMLKQVGGPVRISKMVNHWDADTYSLYYGRYAKEKLKWENGSEAWLADFKPTGKDEEIWRFPDATEPPEYATHLLVYAKNAEWGENKVPGGIHLKDWHDPHYEPEKHKKYPIKTKKGHLIWCDYQTGFNCTKNEKETLQMANDKDEEGLREYIQDILKMKNNIIGGFAAQTQQNNYMALSTKVQEIQEELDVLKGVFEYKAKKRLLAEEQEEKKGMGLEDKKPAFFDDDSLTFLKSSQQEAARREDFKEAARLRDLVKDYENPELRPLLQVKDNKEPEDPNQKKKSNCNFVTKSQCDEDEVELIEEYENLEEKKLMDMINERRKAYNKGIKEFQEDSKKINGMNDEQSAKFDQSIALIEHVIEDMYGPEKERAKKEKTFKSSLSKEEKEQMEQELKIQEQQNEQLKMMQQQQDVESGKKKGKGKTKEKKKSEKKKKEKKKEPEPAYWLGGMGGMGGIR